MTGKLAHTRHDFIAQHHTLIISMLLVVLIGFAYWQVTGHDFINLDDRLYITANSKVQEGITIPSVQWAFTTTHASNWHPLAWLSHMLDVEIFGLNPGMHHLVNVIFHCLNTVLLFLVLGRMTGELWRSAFVAALFGLHPLHVESVAWVSERKDVLSTLFFMLTLLAYFWYTRHTNVKRYMVVLVLFGLGLMAKPMLVTLPFVLLLLDYWPLKRLRLGSVITEQGTGFLKSTSYLILEKVPIFVLAAASAWVTLFAQKTGGAVGSMDAFPLIGRLENASVSYAAYLVKMMWPMNLAVFYPYSQMLWWQVIGSSIVLASVSVSAVYLIRRHPWFIVGWLWYIGTLVPVIGIVQVGAQSMADRYTYIPLIGIFIMIAWGVPILFRKVKYANIMMTVAAGIVLVIFTSTTWVQVSVWKDDVSLSQHAIDVTGDNYLAHNNLGLALESQGKMAEAADHYQKAIEMNPRYVDAHVNYGIVLMFQGKIDQAIHHYRTALSLRPNSLEAQYNLGRALVARGDLEGAIERFHKVLAIDPLNIDARNGMGVAYAKMGDLDSSIQAFEAVLQINPTNTTAQKNLEIVRSLRNRRQ